MAMKAAEQLSRLWRIIWKNALRALFEYSLRFGIIRQLFSGEMATHRCQSTAEGGGTAVGWRPNAHKTNGVKNVNNAGVLYFCMVCLSYITAQTLSLSPFISVFFFFPPFFLALFKVIPALHMAD